MDYPDNVEILIGLVGKKGTGKTVVADYLREEHRFKEVKFAGPLKEDLSRMLDVSMEIIEPQTSEMRERREKWIHPVWGMTVREMLQKFGTDAIRNNFHPDFWVKRLDMMLKERFQSGRLVISDVRFRNEINYVLNCGGHIVKVERHQSQSDDDHGSEIDLDGYDYPHTLVVNNTSFQNLWVKMDYIVEGLKKSTKQHNHSWEYSYDKN